MTDKTSEPTFQPRIAYSDSRGAAEWLEKAGFKPAVLATDAGGHMVYAEMNFGNGCLTIGGEWENVKPPGSIGGENTQNIHQDLDG
jgi:hypothetical protein